MLLKAFPDIHWIRNKAKTNFEDRKDVNGRVIPGKGWPNVVLSTTSKGAERTDILAPFSMFLNLKGKGLVVADGREVTIDQDSFCLVNKGQNYDLIIPEAVSTTTFNVHFGQELFEHTAYARAKSHEHLLDNPHVESCHHHVFTRSRWLEPDIARHIILLQDFYNKGYNTFSFVEEEEVLLHNLLTDLLKKTDLDRKGFSRISSVKPTTKRELMSRMLQAIDYIHAHYQKPVSLNELSQVCLLSRFHFLRVFKSVFHCTPHEYIISIRIQKAEMLLKHTKLQVSEIADMIGFAEANSFSRFFHKYHKVSPLKYRKGN
ncbi:helix-turn-helix transcriptional regulator [Fulvivirga sp. 29W222]|uniref:Helix-turn-helix transcriptional regulator n=1 Tax=Fulvivirga marina TaxID=2494733 RepID=A0A937KGP2_9BACT|nr:AraC family transcriptional regulator [Fulvivirga marina]MBL6449388.1 helix-turn-helix transcriptional regulator [Fulvivirga marina]